MSANGSSIIARLGLDAGELRVGLTAAVKNVQQAQLAMQKAAEQSARAQQDAAKETARVQKEAAEQATATVRRAIERRSTDDSASGATGKGARGSGNAMAQAGLNISRQAADVAVTASMGMDPTMILMQQGPQLADAFAVARMQGLSVASVLRSVATQALKLGGPAAALFGLFTAVSKTEESLKETQQANDKLSKALSVAATTVEGMRAKRAAVQELAAGSEKATGDGFFRKTAAGKIYESVRRAVTGKDPEMEALKLQRDSQEDLIRLDAQSAAMIKAEAAAREQLANGSERLGQLELSRLKTEQKVNALRDNTTLGLEDRQAMMKAAAQEGALELQAINRKYDAKERELKLEEKLLAIKRDGKNVEVETASARLSDAVAGVQAAGSNEEKKAAGVALLAAEDAYREAKKKAEEQFEKEEQERWENQLEAEVKFIDYAAEAKDKAAKKADAQEQERWENQLEAEVKFIDDAAKAKEKATKKAEQAAEKAKRSRETRRDNFIDDKMDGPAEALANRREKRKRASFGDKFDRMEALRARGGMSLGDAARNRAGLSTGGLRDTGGLQTSGVGEVHSVRGTAAQPDLTEALDQSRLLQNIEKNTRGGGGGKTL